MIPQRVKKQFVEPKIYAILIKSPRSRVMHFGVHFSLDEAYGAARKTLEAVTPNMAGESVDIDMWHSLSAEDALNGLLEANAPQLMRIPDTVREVAESDVPDFIKEIFGVPPTPKTLPPTFESAVLSVKEAKNNLIQGLITTGDATKIEKIGSILTPHEKRYVLKKISEKAPNIAPEDPSVDSKL